MSDVVISGRIPKGLMEQLKQLSKSNTQILNEALELYISKINDNNQCIQPVYKVKDSDEYNLLIKVLDNIPLRYNRFYKASDDDFSFKPEPKNDVDKELKELQKIID